MIIKSLELSDFRNYENLIIKFDKGTNILYGDNAQGKTNILEAIYMSATTKSHRLSKDKDILEARIPTRRFCRNSLFFVYQKFDHKQ